MLQSVPIAEAASPAAISAQPPPESSHKHPAPPIRAALAYAQHLGWPVFPIHWIAEGGTCSCGRPECGSPGKHPLTAQGFKEATFDEAQIDAWWSKWPQANIGIPTGQASGFDVLDVDPRHGGDGSLSDLEDNHGKLPETVVQLTGGGGQHILFQHQGGIGNKTGFLPGLDVRGEGGYVLVAPSNHYSGGKYTWELSSRPGKVDIAEWPGHLLELLRKPAQVEKGTTQLSPQEVRTTAYGRAALQDEAELVRNSPPGKQEPTLNAAALKLGGLVAVGELEYQEVFAALVEAGGQMRGEEGKAPWTAEQVREKVERGLSDGMKQPRAVPAPKQEGAQDEEDQKKVSMATEIANFVLQDAELFHDETHTPFARVQIKDHLENWRIDSEGFGLWLQRRIFERMGRPSSGESMSQALGVIKGKALFEGEKHRLDVRVAWQDGILWYDLSNPVWSAVRVTPQDWAICADPPILFTRHNHQAAQVDPVAGGDVRRLFEFISVADEGTQLLLLVWLVSCFAPGFPHPMPILYGPHGSGKSSTFRILRKLIDPSVLETLTFPRDVAELVQKLSHHWGPLFDNVTSLSPWQSDALCRAVTGEGYSKRALYTNDEDHIYHYQRCIGLNGINIVATNADLLDRAILIGLERIAPRHRKTEEAMEAAFATARPLILGGIFDTLVKALQLKPDVKLTRLPRMADFARWGCAIAQALGYQAEEFLGAYRENLQQQNREVLEGHPVAAAVIWLMEDQDLWEGEPGALGKVLEEVAERKGITTKGQGWPKGISALIRKLNEVKTNLQEAGISIERTRSGRRLVKVWKTPSMPSKPFEALQGNALRVDGIGQTAQASSANHTDRLQESNRLDGMDALDGNIPTLLATDLRHVEL